MAQSATTALRQQTGVAQPKQTFPQLLDAMKGEIVRSLPRHMTGDRFSRVALTAFRTNPTLANCDPKSILAAIMIASQLGLEIGVLGHAYLVPYKAECQLIPGWMGLVDLVARAGKATVWTGAIYQGDDYNLRLGDSPKLTVLPNHTDESDELLTHVYACGRVKGSEFPVIEFWSKEKVIKHRNRYNKVGDRHYSYKHLEAYGRKVALLQVLKYIPRSVEMSTVQELEYAADSGSQKLTIDGAKQGVFEAPEPALELPEQAQKTPEADFEFQYEPPAREE